MLDNEFLFAETGAWDQAELRRRDDLTIQPYFGYNVVENASRVRGIYRPIRNLPTQYRRGNRDDFEGFVFSQGKILFSYDARIFDGSKWSYQNAKEKLGVKALIDGAGGVKGGDFYAFRKADNSLQVSPWNSPYWGYSDDIQGLVGPANGTSQSVQDYFGTLDTLFSIIDPVTGDDINDTNVATGVKATLRQNLGASGATAKVAGVCMADTMRETRNNGYQYQRKISAITVAKEGYYRIPFVIAGTGHTGFTAVQDPTLAGATLGNYTTLTSHKQYIATKDQAALIIENPASLLTGAKVYVDKWGNPIIPDAANVGNYFDLSTVGADFTLTGFDFSVRMPMGNETMHYPGLEVASNQTGGIDYSIYALAKKIEPSSTVEALRNLIIGSESARWYGWATIRYEVQ